MMQQPIGESRKSKRTDDAAANRQGRNAKGEEKHKDIHTRNGITPGRNIQKQRETNRALIYTTVSGQVPNASELR